MNLRDILIVRKIVWPDGQIEPAGELPIILDLVELDKDQTLDSRVWVKFRLSVSRIPTLVKRCGILGGVESVVVVTPKDCSI